MKMTILVCALLLGAGVARAADASKVAVTPVARTNTTATGQPIVVPDHPDVVVSIASFPPGARLPEHEHHFPHYAYVLKGVLTVINTQTNATMQVKTGDFLVEMQDTWHYGVNKGRVPVKLLIIDQVPHGTKGNVVLKGP